MGVCLDLFESVVLWKIQYGCKTAPHASSAKSILAKSRFRIPYGFYYFIFDIFLSAIRINDFIHGLP